MASFLDNVDLAGLSAYLSGAAKASASANEAEGRYYNARDAIKAGMFGTQANAATQANAQGLNNAKFSTSLPGQGASEAVRGALIQNVQDVGMNLGNNHANPVTFTGGTRPSVLTPEARAAGGDLIKHGQALIADPGSFVPTQQAVVPPALSDEPKAGFWGQAAAAGGTAAGLLNALSGKGDKSGGNVPLDKIINWLKGGGKGAPPWQGPTDQPDWQGPTDDPDWQGPSDEPGLTPNVDTSTEFGGIPGGYPNNPEDPNSVDPTWWQGFGDDGNSAEGAGASVNGTDWWDE